MLGLLAGVEHRHSEAGCSCPAQAFRFVTLASSPFCGGDRTCKLSAYRVLALRVSGWRQDSCHLGIQGAEGEELP